MLPPSPLMPFIRDRRRTVRPHLVAAALAAFIAVCPLPAISFEILAVKSADLKPYQDVLRGVRDGCECDVRELKLRDEEGKEKILQAGADGVVAVGTTVFKKVKDIEEVPLVYTMVVPSETFFLQSSISGVSMDLPPSAYYSAIKQLLPGVKRIGLIYDPQHTAAFVSEAARAARDAGIELVSKTVHHPSETTALLEDMRKGIDLFWMIPDATVVTAESIDYLLRFSFQNNLPVFSFSKKYVEMGAIAALDIDPYDMGVQAGEILKMLSEGRKGPMRVYARTSHLSVNANVAAKMGLKIRYKTAEKVR